MIKTFWNNLRPPDGSDPVPLTIGGGGGTGLLHQVIDMSTVYNRGDLAGIEVEVTTGVVAPNAVDLTVYYAFSTKANRTPAQLATAAASQIATLPNSVSTIRVYSLPINYQGAQYLHIWFDQAAMAATAVITLELSVLARTSD